MTDTSRHGMARPLVRRIQPILTCQPCLRTPVSYVPGLNTALAMTWRHTRLFPRPDLARVVPSRCPSPRRGRRESRALTAPASPCAMGRQNAHGFDRYSRDIPAFPAQWFDGLYVLSPGKRPFLPPFPAGLTAKVTPGSRRQD